MSGLMHPDHVLYTKAAKRAFEGHLERGEWAKARELGLLCLNSYRKYKVRLLFMLGIKGHLSTGL